MQNLYMVTTLETHLRTITRAVVAESEEAAEQIACGLEDGEYVEMLDEFHECVGDKDVDTCDQVTDENEIQEVLKEWNNLTQCVDCGSFHTLDSTSNGCECWAKEDAVNDLRSNDPSI